MTGADCLKCQLGLIFALVASSVTTSPAQAGLDETSEVLTEPLVNVRQQHLPDLTTAPQRATCSVPEDAKAIAPANPADWTRITNPVPGVLITGTLNDDQHAQFLLRLPMTWNGKLVVGGTAATRSEFNGDLVISDYVLQKGYAYTSQNKGTWNSKLTGKSDPNACPLYPVTDCVAGSPTCPLVYPFLLDKENSIAEWGERLNQAALIAKAIMPWGYRTGATKCARPLKTTQRPSMGALSGKRFCGNARVRTSLGNYRLA